MILRARHILPVNAPPVENGALRIERTRIVEVGPAAKVTGTPVTDLGDCVVVPGLVNAHTHLELTNLAGKVPPGGDFAGWVGRLVEAIKDSGNDEAGAADAVRRGRDLSLTAGVTTVGDITRQPGLLRRVLADGPLRVVSFGEVIAIGSRRRRLEERLAAAADRADESRWLQAAISPHAPYTLEPDGIRACVDRAAREGMRLCMHLAETAEEADFTTGLAGPLRRHLQRAGVWDDHVPCPGLGPIEYAENLGLLVPNTLLAHVNYATDDDLDRLASSGVHVAYCPRTHAAFEHGPHRFKEMLRRGINVCIATDSLASNPSLSVLEELRFCRRHHPDLPAALLIEVGTVRAARALGLASQVGSITSGMQADLAVIPLDPDGASDPAVNILGSGLQPTAACVAGQWVGPVVPG